MKVVLRIHDTSFKTKKIEIDLFDFGEFNVRKNKRGRKNVSDTFYIELSTANKAPDVLRYFMKWEQGKFVLKEPISESSVLLNKIEKAKYDELPWQDYKLNSSFNTKPNGTKNIVLILESPHLSEFDCTNHPIAPAMGSTGNKIHSLLPNILKDNAEIERTNYNLIICNPVQYQASLGHAMLGRSIYKSLRDVIWKYIFNESKEKDFKKRISSYSPSYIINACTSDLKPLVKSFLKDQVFEIEKKGTIMYFEINHPSSSEFKVLKNLEHWKHS